MGKSRMLIIGVLLLAIMAVSSVSTYAAYTTTSSGGTGVSTARFSFRLNKNDVETKSAAIGNITIKPGDTDVPMGNIEIDTSGTDVPVNVTANITAITAEGTLPAGMKIDIDGNHTITASNTTAAIQYYSGKDATTQSHILPIVVSWTMNEEEWAAFKEVYPYTDGGEYTLPAVTLTATVTVAQATEGNANAPSLDEVNHDATAAEWTPIKSIDTLNTLGEEAPLEEEAIG